MVRKNKFEDLNLLYNFTAFNKIGFRKVRPEAVSENVS